MIHAFLLIGQSNMAGRGKAGEVAPIENPHLWMLRNGRWQPMTMPVNPDRPFAGVGLAERFADLYQRDHDVEVGLIPCADGGTRIEQWQPGGLLFDHAVMQTQLAERTASLAGILWHQGESNCKPGRFDGYAERFETFYTALVKELHAEKQPFLVGGLGSFLSELPEESAYYERLNVILEETARKHPMIGFVSAEGLQGYPDHLHFTANAQRTLGERYYRAFCAMEPKDRVFSEKPHEDNANRPIRNR